MLVFFFPFSFGLNNLCSVLCLVTQSCLTLCNPMDCSPPDCSVRWYSPGKNTGMGCNALLQGIFPTQGLHPGLQHCRQILYRLSQQGRLNNLAHYHWKLNTIYIYIFIYLFGHAVSLVWQMGSSVFVVTCGHLLVVCGI